MAKVSSEVEIAAPAAAVWDLYFDSDRWSLWVDQFAAVVAADGYPQEGGTLVWRSGRAGRGEVSERVLEHQPRRMHRIAFTDPETEGELATTFDVIEGGTRVRQELDYSIRRGGVFVRVSDLLFVRSQMRSSLARSLGLLQTELGG